MDYDQVMTPKEVLEAVYKEKLSGDFLTALNKEIVSSFDTKTGKAEITTRNVYDGELSSDGWALVKRLYGEKGWHVYEDDYNWGVLTFRATNE